MNFLSSERVRWFLFGWIAAMGFAWGITFIAKARAADLPIPKPRPPAEECVAPTTKPARRQQIMSDPTCPSGYRWRNVVEAAPVILAQYYGGPPMWDRRYDPEEERQRWPRTHIGPQAGPCIYYGNCRGPRYEEDPEESWRRPSRRRYGPYYGPY